MRIHIHILTHTHSQTHNHKHKHTHAQTRTRTAVIWERRTQDVHTQNTRANKITQTQTHARTRTAHILTQCTHSCIHARMWIWMHTCSIRSPPQHTRTCVFCILATIRIWLCTYIPMNKLLAFLPSISRCKRPAKHGISLSLTARPNFFLFAFFFHRLC